MKLIIPIFIIALGMLAGAAVCKVFKETPTGVGVSMLAGGAGAFVGLVTRDFMDVTYGGQLWGALLAATIGALLLATAANLLYRRGEEN